MADALKFLNPAARHSAAFKLGRWDGMVSFCTIGGATYINLLDRVLPIIEDAGYTIELEDHRLDCDFNFLPITNEVLADRTWPANHPKAGQPIMLRDHQTESINRFFLNPNSVQEIATGAGKSIMTAVMSLAVEKYGRSIVIVPSKSLVEQTAEDYRNVGLDTGVFYGDKKEIDKTHTIITWQSLGVVGKKYKKDAEDPLLPQLLKNVACVIIDEAHTGTGAILKDTLCGPMAHIPLRWGMTGTLPKEDHELYCIKAAIGHSIGNVTAFDLQEKKILAKCHINILQLNDSRVEYPSYDTERDFLTTDKDRLNWIAEFCQSTSIAGNTLILVDRIETGKFLQSCIEGSVFISGAMKTNNRKKEYDSVQTANDKPIIATFGVAAVGINIPRIFNLILVDCGKSHKKVIQSIGRALRMAEDKDFANIYDICSTLKFSKSHLSKRKKFYTEAQYPFSMKKITYTTTTILG